jgi:gamma-glutamyl-gamma-aminobutyrate hydrolase PuuD
VVEAVESAGDWWALGLQWHVELLDDPPSQRVFDAFVAEASAA